jgi:hypothetical protein
MENIDWQKSGDAIDEAESAEIYEQSMMQRGKAARTIAGKLRYAPMLSEGRYPNLVMFEAGHEDYLDKDRSQEVFENKDIAEHVKATYADVIAEHPELKAVEVISTPGYYGGNLDTWQTTEGDEAAHLVVSGDYSDKSSEDLVSETGYYACKMMAIQLAVELGCSSADIMLNSNLQRDMVFLHEMGHARNFINDYLKPIYRRVKKEGAKADFLGFEFEDVDFTQALSESIDEYKLRSETATDARYLNPGSLKSFEDAKEAGLCKADDEKAYMDNAWERLKLRFLAGGALNESERVVEDARRYRTADEEHSADQFALDYIMAHLDKYFLKPGEEDDGTGRIATKGGEVDVTGPFCVAFNYVPGNEVILKSEDGEVSGGRFVDYPAEGTDLLLTSSNDPDDKSSYRSYGKVQQAVCETIIDEQGERHRKMTVETDQGSFLMSTAREVHQLIKRTPEELAAALGVKKDQELQMISLVTLNDEEVYEDNDEYGAMVGSGGVIYGKMTEDIKIGEPIELMIQSDLEHLSPWRSWPVESIEQDWRTWRINMKLGDKKASYEIMPLPTE